MTPSRIANEAKKVAKEEALNLKILEQRDMEQLGMGALLGVARGSHEPPKFIVLEHHGGEVPHRIDDLVALPGQELARPG